MEKYWNDKNVTYQSSNMMTFFLCFFPTLFIFSTLILTQGFFFFNSFIHLFLAALGLRSCTWTFSSCGERGLLFIVVCGLLIAVASLVVEHGL